MYEYKGIMELVWIEQYGLRVMYPGQAQPGSGYVHVELKRPEELVQYTKWNSLRN